MQKEPEPDPSRKGYIARWLLDRKVAKLVKVLENSLGNPERANEVRISKLGKTAVGLSHNH